jgi:hypothetical protein
LTVVALALAFSLVAFGIEKSCQGLRNKKVSLKWLSDSSCLALNTVVAQAF